MKLKREKGDYKAPPIGMMVGASIDCGGYLYAVMQVRASEIETQRDKTKDLLGRPIMFALSDNKETLKFFPAPDDGYEVRLRFYPPMIEA